MTMVRLMMVRKDGVTEALLTGRLSCDFTGVSSVDLKASSGMPLNPVWDRYGPGPQPMLNDDELFADIARRKALGQDYKRPLGRTGVSLA